MMRKKRSAAYVLTVCHTIRRRPRQAEKRDVVRRRDDVAGVPAGAVEHEYGMSPRIDCAADLAQMEVHGFAVGVGLTRAAPTARCGQTAPNR
jgi:hypothetical protein